MPKLVFLATDLALYGLVAVIAFYIWHALRTPTLRATWRSVLHDPAAMSAGVVLVLFLVIAHAGLVPLPAAAARRARRRRRCRARVFDATLSVLDALLAGPRERARRPTRRRSAPTVREGVELADGKRSATSRACSSAARISRTRPANGEADVIAPVAARDCWAARSPQRCCGLPSRRCARGRTRPLGRVAARDLAPDHRSAVAGDAADGRRDRAVRGLGRRAMALLPRLRHRQDRQRRPVPGAQEHPHRAGHRHADHDRDAAVCHRLRHPGRLLQGPGRRRHPVRLHGADVDSVGAADRRVRADDPGLHRQESAAVRHRARARRHPAVPAGRDPGHHRLDRACAAAARRNAQAGRAGLRAGGARLRRLRRAASCAATSCPTSRTSS